MKEWDDSIVDFAAPQDGFLTRSFGGRSGPLMLDNGAPITFPWQSQQEIAGTAPSTIVSYDDTGVGFTALSLEGPTMVAGANRAYLDLRGRSAGGAQLIMGDGSALNFVAINDDQVNISSTGSGLILNNADLTIVGDDTIWIHNNLTTGTTVDVESNAALNLIGVPVNINGVDVSTGLGAWTAYTPTIGGGSTVGNGTANGYYAKLGKSLFLRLRFTLGSTSTIGATLTMSLPSGETAVTETDGFQLMPAILRDTGVVVYHGVGQVSSAATVVTFYAQGSGGTYLTQNAVTTTVPHTWGSTDVVTANGVVQVA